MNGLSGKGFGRRLGFGLVLMAAGCASAPTPAARGARTTDEVGEAVLAALKAADVDRARAWFAPALGETLSAATLRATLDRLTAEHGTLRSWRLVASEPGDGRERLRYELGFARGAGTGVLAIDRRDLAVIELSLSGGKGAAAAGPAPTARFAAEIVRVGQWPDHLEGVLTRPARPGTFPAVVLLGAPAGLDRDATQGARRPFRDLGEGLAEHGVVALRYDQRTAIKAVTGAASTAVTADHHRGDAERALALLRARPEVRREAVFVIAHADGARLATELARRDGALAGLILLAPPPPAKLKPAAETLARPVLLLQGSRDPALNQQEWKRWQAALTTAPASTAVVLPGLDHLLVAEGAEGKIAPAAVVRVSAFIKQIAARTTVARQ